MMAMTRAQWESLQARLPVEDRTSYEDYLQTQGMIAPAPSRVAAREQGILGAASIARQITPQIAQNIQNIPSLTVTPTPNRYYNYYTGEWVSDPSLIKPRTGMGGAESGGGTIQVTGTEVDVTDETDETEEGDGDKPVSVTVVSTYTDPETGDVIAVYSDGSTKVLSKGTKQSDAARIAAEANAAKKARGETAFAIFRSFLDQFGLGALASDVEKYKLEGLSDDELLIRLRTESDAYKKRFAANQQRIAKGLRALSEAEYIQLEDQYQDVMRRYGLPGTYYTRGDLGRQEGFEKFIAGDVSPVELEDRIQTAQNRVTNAPSQVRDALSQFYGAELGNGDILAYVLDPDRALPEIKRKVTAAEIGAGAMQAGLATGVARAEELGRFGVTGEQARQGFATIAEFLPSAQKLSDIYRKQGLGPFTQETAEQEVFGIAGAAEAGRKRRKLTELETATFSGQAGVAGGALARERAGAI